VARDEVPVKHIDPAPWERISAKRTAQLLATGLLRDCTGVLEERIVVIEGKRVSEMRVVKR
jgi:hypothetical protein